jgi:thioredoxin 1
MDIQIPADRRMINTHVEDTMIPFMRSLATSLLLGFFMLATAPAQDAGTPASPPDTNTSRAKVTFIELGSVNCIPCKKMQPVMKAIEAKYAGDVKVVFHDVWTAAGKPQVSKYNVRLIPTQVFLDADGKEFYRHEGFLPEEEIHKLLRKRGLKPRA